jgi:predicted glycoside hydrolase/deacetylase ChbG (UPF0249 family)
VNSDGNFREDMVGSAIQMFCRPSVRQQLAKEVAAQFEAFRATGLALDHVNAHKHFHLHPTIAVAILSIGRAYGMRAVRVPLEPGDVLIAAEPRRAHPIIARHRAVRALVAAADEGRGAMRAGRRVRARLVRRDESIAAARPDRELPGGISEIYLHPATRGGFTGAAPGYRYEEEFAALTDADVIAESRRNGIRLGGFADFLASPRSGNIELTFAEPR